MNVYDSLIEGAQELPASERGQLYAATLEYLYYGREPDFPMRPAPKALFTAMRPVFDNQRAKQEAGRRGGRAKAKTKQTASKTEAEAIAKRKQRPWQTQSETEANRNRNRN